jgi:E3 ubiquitin-protein ligase NEDD4
MPVNGKLSFSFAPVTESSRNLFQGPRIAGPSSHGTNLNTRASHPNLRSNRSRANLTAPEVPTRPPIPPLPTSSPSVLTRLARPTAAPGSSVEPGPTNVRPLAVPPTPASQSHAREPSPQPSTTGQNTQQASMFTDTSGNMLPSGWERRLDDRGRNYYVNRETRVSTWHSPIATTPPEAIRPAPAPSLIPVVQTTSNTNVNGSANREGALPLGWEERQTDSGQAKSCEIPFQFLLIFRYRTVLLY